MADSTAPIACALCGGFLDVDDLDRGTCHECRSDAGKISDLRIAIEANGDDPSRIADWPAIRHLLRKRFGQDRTDLELWERCTDWLKAEGKLGENDYLRLPLSYLRWQLENDFLKSHQLAGTEKLEALLAFQRELESWIYSQSSGDAAPGLSPVIAKHPLQSALVALQPFYGGVLPKPALGHWRAILKLVRNNVEAVQEEAQLLLEWVNREVGSHRLNAWAFISSEDETAEQGDSLGGRSFRRTDRSG